VTELRPARARDATAIWLRCLVPVARPWVRLVCFPHSGGSAAFYRPWGAHLPPDVELYGVQYPGRLDRIAEPGADDVDQLADELAVAVAPLLDHPTALFGHSLGATVAFELARRLPARGVVQLFVSGRVPPQRLRPGTMHLASDDELWMELGRLGGTRPEVLASPELRAAFLPALRNDYRLAETHPWRPGPPLGCPLTAFVGTEDTEVSLADAAAWVEHTRGGFGVRTFAGGHFYLTARLSELTGEILYQLSRHVPGRYGRLVGP